MLTTNDINASEVEFYVSILKTLDTCSQITLQKACPFMQLHQCEISQMLHSYQHSRINHLKKNLADLIGENIDPAGISHQLF